MLKRTQLFRCAKILMVLFLCLGISGCVEVSENLVISEEGMLQIEVIKDSTVLNESENELGSTGEESDEALCSEISLKKEYEITEEVCVVSEDRNVVTVRGQKELEGEAFQKERGYIRFFVEDLFNESGGEMTPDAIAMFKSSGVSMRKNIEMPGEIIAVNRGSFSGNKVTLDVLAEYTKKKEKGSQLIIISRLETATGETPWALTEEFITEPSDLSAIQQQEPDMMKMMEAMMKPMAAAMEEGMQVQQTVSEPKAIVKPQELEVESLEENKTETVQVKSQQETTSMPERIRITPGNTTHSAASLPATGGMGVLQAVWSWITQLW